MHRVQIHTQCLSLFPKEPKIKESFSTSVIQERLYQCSCRDNGTLCKEDKFIQPGASFLANRELSAHDATRRGRDRTSTHSVIFRISASPLSLPNWHMNLLPAVSTTHRKMARTCSNLSVSTEWATSSICQTLSEPAPLIPRRI